MIFLTCSLNDSDDDFLIEIHNKDFEILGMHANSDIFQQYLIIFNIF